MQSTDEENFGVFIQALRFANRGLKQYVDLCLEDIYNRINREVSKVDHLCTTYCNKREKHWCIYCTQWKEQIEKYVRSKRIRWQDIDFGKLAGKDKDLAKTELFRAYVKRHPNTPVEFDIQAMLSLFENCVYFDIGKNKSVLDSVRDIRNKYYSHTVTFDISNVCLKDTIDKLIQMFQHQSLQNYEISKSTITMLKELWKKKNERVENNTHDLCRQLVKFRHNADVSRRKIDMYLSTGIVDSNDSKVTWGLFKHIPLILVLLILSGYFVKQEADSNMKGCKTVDREYPFVLDIDFEFYRSAHGELVGRQWLLYELENKVSVSSKGVMLIAEMGYGKSAIMSHLACQDDRRGAGYSIYANLTVFHICTFESQKTLLPGLFVKNMAGGFAKYIPKFKKHIEQNKRFKDYFEGDKCLQDPEGCLDFLIIKTLQELRHETSTHIVAIDALDECMEYGKFNILSLLLKRISKFPIYIKFLISSRNISPISQISRHLTVYEVRPENYKNKRDIGLLVKEKLKNSHQEEIHRIKVFFKTSDIDEISDKAVRYGKGNMLFAKHTLKFVSGNDGMSLPDILTLETLFYNQFYRIFGKDEDKFSHTRKILEILCASSEPLSEDEIFGIANISDSEQLKVIKIIGNELSHFIRQTNGKIVFLHKTLSDFLTKKERRGEEFYISKQNGCVQLSSHLLKKVRVQHGFKGIDILMLSGYVSCSKNQALKNIFLKLGQKYNSSIEYKSNSINHRPIFLLHRAALTMNSYSSMSLFLDLYLKFTHVDENDDGNITASYVAAAYGNHKALLALLKYGADVNFTRLGPRIINSTFNKIVEFSKIFAQWQYNLLNIASQNGHLQIVRTLLRNKVNVLHKTTCGLNSFHLASEFGQISIVKFFLMNYSSAFRNSLNFSLYLASRNGHDEIVRLLLYHGAVDACLPCSGKMYWTKFHQTRLQVIDNQFDLETFNYICMDDKRMIRCETAVEIAIQNGHTEVVKRLIEHGTTSLQCREAGGRTPVLTAARFDRTNILQYFMSLNVSFIQHCITAYQKREYFDLSEAEEMEYDDNMCMNNMSTFHVVAEFGSSQSLFMMYDQFRSAFWIERDSFGATALHYLACRGRMELGSHFETEYLVKSYNGSTPLHSAAICKQCNLLAHLFTRISESLFDNNKQSVTHYLARSESFKYGDRLFTRDCGRDLDTVLQRIREELFFRDKMGRTALHYAAINGNVNFLQLCFKSRWNQDIWDNLLNLPDINNETILDLVFKNLPQINDFPTKASSSICSPPYDSRCLTTKIASMNPHQYFIYLILEASLSFANNILEKKLPIYIKRCFQRGNVLILDAMRKKYRHHNHHNSTYDFDISMKESFHIFATLDYIDHEYLYFLPLSDFIKCNCSNSKTFTFHKLMEDPKGSFRIHLNYFLGMSMNCTGMNFCYDNEGLNPLHRTVVSGNFLGFKFLLNTGMSVNVKTRDGRDILQLLVEYKPYTPVYREIKALNVSKSPYSNNKEVAPPHIIGMRKYKDIEAYIAKHTALLRNRTPMQICNSKSKSLSFSHLVAARGLVVILDAIKENFGEEKSKCVNHLNISTAYLLSMFGHLSLFSVDIKWVQYLNDASAALYLKFAYDFKTFVYPKGSALWKCKQKILNLKNTKALLSCAGRVEEEFMLLLSQLIKLTGLKSKEDVEERSQVCKFDKTHSSSTSDFVCYIKQVKTYWQNPEAYKYTYLIKYNKLEIELKKLKGEMKQKRSSEHCLSIISKMIHMKRWRKLVYLYRSVQIPLLTITYLYEHDIFKPFSADLNAELIAKASDNLIKLSIFQSQLHPGYQSLKEYAYWDVLSRQGDIRSKKVVQTILNTPISEIRKWKGTMRSRPYFKYFLFKSDDVLQTDKPLHYYENLSKKKGGSEF